LENVERERGGGKRGRGGRYPAYELCSGRGGRGGQLKGQRVGKRTELNKLVENEKGKKGVVFQ